MTLLPSLHLASLHDDSAWGAPDEHGRRWVITAMASPTQKARQLTMGNCGVHASVAAVRRVIEVLRSGDAEQFARAQRRYEQLCRETAREQVLRGWLHPDARFQRPGSKPAPIAALGRGYGRLDLHGNAVAGCLMLHGWRPEHGPLEVQPGSTLVCHCNPPGKRPVGQDFCHLEIWAPYLAWAGWAVHLYGRELVADRDGRTVVWADTGQAYDFRWKPTPTRQAELLFKATTP